MYSMNIQGFADGQSAPTEPMHEASLSEAETTAADGADTADTAALRKAAYDDFSRRHKAEDEARLGALFKKRFRADKSALQRLSALEASFQSVMDAHGARSLEELSDRLSHGANRAASGDAQTAVSQTYNAWIADTPLPV